MREEKECVTKTSQNPFLNLSNGAMAVLSVLALCKLTEESRKKNEEKKNVW